LYDNSSVYVGGYCYERTKDSVSKELIGRDKVGINDFLGVIFDTYNDKINGFGFYVTPYGDNSMLNIPVHKVKMTPGMGLGQ
jgi:hypothetical protein